MKSAIIYHIAIPLFISILFFAVGLSPIDLLGCVYRGLIALVLAFISALLGIISAIIGLKGRMRGDAKSIWWILSALIFTIPVIGLIVLA